MAWYTYDPMVAIDQTGTPLRSGHGQIFARTDLTFASPLAITGPSGEPLPNNEVEINALGLTQEFRVEAPYVYWKSGPYVVSLSSPEGMLEESTSARQAAQQAQLAAQQAAESASASAQAAEDAANVPGVGGTDIPAWVHVIWRQPIAPTNGLGSDGWIVT